MRKITCQIISRQSAEEVEALLTSKILKRKGFRLDFLSEKKYLLGNINSLELDLKTFDKPPMSVKGKIVQEESGSRIDLVIISESLKGQLRAVMYALFYPLVFAMVLTVIILNSKDFWSYAGGFLAFIFPLVFVRVYETVYYQEPDPEEVLRLISRTLNGEIRKIESEMEER
ncbi:hypothetical protein RCC89_13800 [Cytophagaceae bacterium ABcell3]|nr:hypothetical protein RCC89_13800 [Cytophagaceae bacterium ABcell3]